MSQIRLVLLLYRRPLAAFSAIVDQGQFLFAAAAALCVMFLFQVPREMEFHRVVAQAEAYVAAHKSEIQEAQEQLKQNPAPADPEEEDDEPAAGSNIRGAIDTFTGQSYFSYLPGLAAIALCFVPAVILLMAVWQSMGSFTTILFRDYLTLLVCVLFAWTAAYLPLALGRALLAVFHAPASNHPAIVWAFHGYFVVLAVCAIRMIFGTGYSQATGVAAGAWAGSIGGLCLYSVVGSGVAWIASPCLLYYLYASVQPGMHAIGGGFRSRQQFKRYLESSTVNPRDADSHYQLGLIHQQRRQYAPAVERFEKAIEIDPGSADAHFQLGRIARQTQRPESAVAHLCEAGRLDDKCSTSEVWRELGAAYLLSGHLDPARNVLSKYLERRPYDPEGQFWYGMTLLKLGLPDAARLAFKEAVEAASTMPCNRRRQVSTWGSQAARELRRLGK